MLRFRRQKFLIRKAVSAGDDFKIRRVIKRSAKVQRHCCRELVKEVGAGNVVAVGAFIRAGVDIAYDGHRAIRCAIVHGRLGIAQMLFPSGVNLSNLPFDPLVLAVSFGYAEILKWLLANGAIITFGDFTVLDLAVALALNVSTSPPYGVPEEVWTACVDVLLDHSLGWPLSPSQAEQVAKNVAAFAPCKAKATIWLANFIPP